jgi:uncharacterized membrane protein YkoI
MPGLASDDTNGVALSATPKAVQNTIHTRVGAGKLEGIDQSCENGEITFDVDWTEKTGEKRAFTVAEDGTLLSVQVELSQTPAEVQKAIQTESGGSPLKCLEKDVEDPDDISYDVLVAKDGRERWFTLDEDGTLLSKEITLGETPPPVQEAVRKKAAGNPVERIEEIFDAEITFEITITSSGGEKSFTAATNGVVLTEQVALENIPQPARKTIRQQIGEGKILRIDRSLVEKKMGVLPFQVQGRKDGKPFDFSVGPKGRFLGKDE